MKVVVASVAENRLPYSREIVYLFSSLAVLGGAMARARRIAYFIGDVDPEHAEALDELGVMVKVVPPLNPKCPHANKIHTLLHDEPCDAIVALDTDVVIARDFSPWIGRAPFAAKPADRNPLRHELWGRLFGKLGVVVPTTRYLTHFRAELTLPYYNSGVIAVARSSAARLGPEWLATVSEVQEVLAADAQLSAYSFFVDQIALAIALVRLEMDQLALPLEMNFPTHQRIHDIFEPATSSPYLLHHHHRFDQQGLITKTGYEGPDAAIASVNSVINPLPVSSVTLGA
jgi:hypothetical protein